MKILILGATGRTGKLILTEALKQGYEINCLVREPKKIKEKNKRLNIYKGSPDRISELENAINGCDGIINALNISSISNIRGLASTVVELTLTPNSNDIVPLRNQILSLDVANSSITVEVDTLAGGSSNAGIGYVTTSSY